YCDSIVNAENELKNQNGLIQMLHRQVQHANLDNSQWEKTPDESNNIAYTIPAHKTATRYLRITHALDSDASDVDYQIRIREQRDVNDSPPSPSSHDSTSTWTLFIYAMGDNDLYPYMGDSIEMGMLSRLKELEGVPESGVSIVLLLDGPGPRDTNYYTLDSSGMWGMLPRDEFRMDEEDTLASFLKWGFERYDNSDYYALSILGHASGVRGLGPDLSSNSEESLALLEPMEIRQAIQAAEDFGQIDVIQFDGCSFGLFESAAIVDDLADYVIASPNTGWGIFDYDVYRGLAGEASTPYDYSAKVATHYADKLENLYYPYTISVFDMAKYDDVKSAMDEFGNALSTYVDGIDARQQELRTLRSTVQIYDSNNYIIDEQDDHYIDLTGFAQAVVDNINDDIVIETAKTVLGIVSNFVVYNRNKSGQFYNDLRHETIDIDLDKAHGIGIFYPYSRALGAQAWENYTNNEIFRNLTTDWGWKKFLANGIPPL
ncbi:MAG: clostripain-related cysteine peptidase, partial [Chloroflexota bacterium]